MRCGSKTRHAWGKSPHQCLTAAASRSTGGTQGRMPGIQGAGKRSTRLAWEVKYPGDGVSRARVVRVAGPWTKRQAQRSCSETSWSGGSWQEEKTSWRPAAAPSPNPRGASKLHIFWLNRRRGKGLNRTRLPALWQQPVRGLLPRTPCQWPCRSGAKVPPAGGPCLPALPSEAAHSTPAISWQTK